MFFKGVEKEKDVERAICDWLSAKGYFFYKSPSAGYYDASRGRFRKHTSPYVLNGTPDLIVIFKGRYIGLEIKSAKGRLSPAQQDFSLMCQKNGGIYAVCRSVEDVVSLFVALGA